MDLPLDDGAQLLGVEEEVGRLPNRPETSGHGWRVGSLNGSTSPSWLKTRQRRALAVIGTRGWASGKSWWPP